MIRAIRGLTCLLVICGVAIAARTLLAQNPPPAGQQPPPGGQQPPPRTLEQQLPTFRTRIDSVSVDVVVTDKQGKPVTDLKEDDFEIRESNKPQAIDSFKLVKLDEPEAGAPTQSHVVRSISDMGLETGRDDTRVIVVFLDDYHVRRGNAMSARQNVARFISQLGDHDLVAVMYPLMRLSDLTFTQDHDGTAQAVMAFEGRKYDYTPKNAYEDRLTDQPVDVIERVRNDIVISALKGLCVHLGTLRPGRKSVLLLSEGLSGYIPPGVKTTGAMAPMGSVRTPTSLDDRVATMGTYDVQSQMQDVYRAANRSNTALYTLDPRGLAPSEFGPQDTVSPDADHRFLTETTDMLRTIADQTDGRSIVGRNDPLPDLRQMIRDSSAYYLIGYTSTLAPRDGRFHSIQVKVKRKDVDVRAKKGYWAYTMDEIEKATNVTPKVGPPPEVQEALEMLDDSSRGRAVRVWMGAERGTGGKAKVTLAWEAAPDQPGNQPVDHLNVTISSIFGDLLFKGLVPKDPQAIKPSGRVSFDAPAGEVHVQVIAEDARGQRVDHAEDAIEVPDFAGIAPFVTAPFIYRARTAREIQTLRAATDPPAPTVSREFSRTERLLIRFQAAGPNGSAPTLTARLLNPLGQTMMALPAPAVSTRGGFEIELSLGGFAPGDYLLEVAGATDAAKPSAPPEPVLVTEPVRAPQTNAAANKTLIAFRITG